MTPIVIAMSAAYAVMGVVLLGIGLTARINWKVKAFVIVLTCAFFVEQFYSTTRILGYPATTKLPARFQLLWTTVNEPDLHDNNPGAVFIWVEALDENNVPDGEPRSYRLPYSKPLASKASNAKDQIMQGNPQSGTADDMNDNGDNDQKVADKDDSKKAPMAGNQQKDNGGTKIEMNDFLANAQKIDFAPLPLPLLPAKQP